MYGYVRPNIPELKVREKQRYDAWYCGLCRSIGKRYSLLSRLVLSYDSAFLAMLLSDVSGKFSPCAKRTCPIRPLGRKKVMVDSDSPALDYAADVCVILAEFKLKDDARDGKKLRGAAKLPLSNAFKKAREFAPELHDAVDRSIDALNAIESEKKPSLDLAANAFGELMRSVMRLAPLPTDMDSEKEEQTRTVLSELGYWLGRAIYFLDAWDDRDEDEKRGLYNPFIITGASKQDADFEINYSINSAVSAYNLLDGAEVASPDRAIEDNVFYQGLFAMWDSISSGKKAKRSARSKSSGNYTDEPALSEEERMDIDE
ncbi:MAG: hypothetical protein IKZ82_04435 [Clostridia bacterium]|nr:hypothetical protein [Clostridia bacterium]